MPRHQVDKGELAGLIDHEQDDRDDQSSAHQAAAITASHRRQRSGARVFFRLPGAPASSAGTSPRRAADHGNTRNVRQAESGVRPFARDEFHRGSDADLGEIDACEYREPLRSEMNLRMRLQRGADALLASLDLQRAGNDAPDISDGIPFGRQLRGKPAFRPIRKEAPMNTALLVGEAGEPSLLSGEADERSEPGR